MREPLLILDDELRIVSGNESFYRTFQVSRADAVGQPIRELVDGQWNTPQLREQLEQILPRDSVFENSRVEHCFHYVGQSVMMLNARRLEQALTLPGRILLAIENVAHRDRLTSPSPFDTHDGIMDPSDLRQAALRQLERSSANIDKLQHKSCQELIHELRVQQIELELQNEELRRAQLELEESRDRFANLFDFSPVGYLTIDADNRIIEANLTIAKLLGVERGKLVGQMLRQYVAPEETLRLSSHLREVRADDRQTICELTLIRTDGNRLWVRFHSIPVADDRGGNSCSIAITDLSKKAAIIREKQDSDERLRVICHALPIPIAYIDRMETYQFNNAAHERWFKISREAIAGRHVKEVLGGKTYDVVASRIKQSLAGDACSCRYELPGGEFDPRLVEVHYAPHRHEDDGVIGVYELIIDVSANRHLERTEARRAELESQLSVLSSRQRAVFELLMAGKSNKTIARELDRSMRTVERERHNIVQLLGVESVSEMLVKFAGFAASDAPDQETR